MAGEWFAVDVDLDEKREVIAIQTATGCTLDEVVGRLVRFWGWVQRQAAGSTLDGLTLDRLAERFGGDVSFWCEVEAVGWLVVTDRGVRVPGFRKRFRAAKVRQAAAKRDARTDGQAPPKAAALAEQYRKAANYTGSDGKVYTDAAQLVAAGVLPHAIVAAAATASRNGRKKPAYFRQVLRDNCAENEINVEDALARVYRGRIIPPEFAEFGRLVRSRRAAMGLAV